MCYLLAIKIPFVSVFAITLSETQLSAEDRSLLVINPNPVVKNYPLIQFCVVRSDPRDSFDLNVMRTINSKQLFLEPQRENWSWVRRGQNFVT